LNPSQGNLVERMVKQTDNAEAVRDAFLTVLSRPPTSVELTRVVDFFSADAQQRGSKCREVVWALLCSSEFRFNH
jgi:hypothetical protein